MLKRIGFILLVIAIPIFVLLTTVQFVVMWDGFFRDQYLENGVVMTTNIEIDDLMKITDEIQEFLLGDRQDFAIKGVIDGQEQIVFKEREIVHMEDVKNLFHTGIILRNVCGLLTVICGICFYKKDKTKLYKAMKYSAITFIVVGGLLAIVISQDFNKYFVVFHKIFFTNDYWILDPMESVLINMVDIHFFMSIATLILGTSLALLLSIGVLGSLMERKMNRNQNLKFIYKR
ncbi:integral membrane protein (TIGR01906 family) [Alkalibaculum bacchi]|uniref:Integral membrane protein (TIGR01906 family) n=1 Tax=Alkalibaculum bacchi TaxID=645887 RepID=A0A366IF75_9FIRM|nr:TIGR01906 family membrane protein [Alkalibaculum bacchi]RBP70033.1 integral membrane protein (TIGR01906 family) [Alkalibaculum bacchi]